MKILLINAPTLKMQGITSQIYPPLGLLYIASYARSRRPDFEFKVLDGYQENPKEIMHKISEFAPDVLGMSFTTQAANGAYKLINEMKERRQDIHIVAGGAHPTIFPREVLMKSKTDIVVVGEGEYTFCEVLEYLDKGELSHSITGTAVRNNGKITRNPLRPFIEDLDSLPFPARDLINLKRYRGYIHKKQRHDINLISSRGCPYNCVICANAVWKTQKPWFRSRSPENVVDEMEFLIDKYGIREFYDYADELNANITWTKAISDEIVKRGLNIFWKAQMKIGGTNLIDDELAEKLRQSGFWLASFGIESTNNRTLKGINKKQTIEQIENSLNIMKRHDIKCFGFFIAFNVWEEGGNLCHETKEDCFRTLDHIKKWTREKKLHSFGWGLATPYPGSQLYEIAVKHNVIDQNHIGKWELFDSTANFTMNIPAISQNDWLQVLNAGKRLQAKLLLTSGAWHISDFRLYLKKAMYLAGKNIEKRILSKVKNGIHLFVQFLNQ